MKSQWDKLILGWMAKGKTSGMPRLIPHAGKCMENRTPLPLQLVDIINDIIWFIFDSSILTYSSMLCLKLCVWIILPMLGPKWAQPCLDFTVKWVIITWTWTESIVTSSLLVTKVQCYVASVCTCVRCCLGGGNCHALSGAHFSFVSLPCFNGCPSLGWSHNRRWECDVFRLVLGFFLLPKPPSMVRVLVYATQGTHSAIARRTNSFSAESLYLAAKFDLTILGSR